MTPEERFWEKVLILGPDDCWEWQGCILAAGYGQLSFRGVRVRAHRLVWFFTYGVWPELPVLHNCPNGDNPACCNPRHLWLGTQLENIADRDAKGRQAKGEGNHSKATENDIVFIREYCRDEGYGAQARMAVEFGMSPQNTANIVYGRKWSHAGGPIKGKDY